MSGNAFIVNKQTRLITSIGPIIPWRIMSSIKSEKCRLYREFNYNRADFSSVYCRGSIVVRVKMRAPL